MKNECAKCEQLRAALVQAVEVIRVCHRQHYAPLLLPRGRDPGPRDVFKDKLRAGMLDEAWEIYQTNSPQMRKIMEALKQ